MPGLYNCSTIGYNWAKSETPADYLGGIANVPDQDMVNIVIFHSLIFYGLVFIMVLINHYIILLSKDYNVIYHIIYMIKYYPYKSDKPNKKYYIITNDNKKFILVLLVILILQYRNVKQENKDI